MSNYLFESALAEVSERCQEYVFALTGGALSLRLLSSSSLNNTDRATTALDEDDDDIEEVTKTQLEKIERVIFARKQHPESTTNVL